MIGDAKARGKVRSTTHDMPVYTEKRSRLGGVKTVASSTGKNDNDSGGDHEQHVTAKRMTKGMKPGTGLSDGAKHMPTPRRTIPPRSQNDSGGRIEEWCQGKRSDYK